MSRSRCSLNCPATVRLAKSFITAGILLFAFSTVAVGEESGREFLYLENTDSGEISVISIAEQKVVSTISLGTFLDDVAISSDGRVLYANRVESSGHPFSKRIGESGEIIAISTETEEILWRTPVHGWPHHITLSADDGKLFVPLFDRMFMEVIDIEQRKVVAKFPSAIGSHGTRLSPDGKRLYVGSMMMDMIVVYDVKTYQPLKRIPFQDAVRPFVMTRDEKTLYVQLSRLHGFQVVDLQTNQVVRQVDLPAIPKDVELPQFYPHTYNHGLEISPDEKYLFAAASATNSVCVFTLPDLKLVATIPVGKEPNWIVFDSRGRFAYVSNRLSNTVSVIRVDTLQQMKQISVGQYPQRMVTAIVPHRKPKNRKPKNRKP